ncbi:uncharacterized protein LOC117177826 [Belonocnema kinseyi]|uniref:uncharacterized protein LOC117177826 n=1 Tax=Belonocnema kinseyi TaxID=2817044 RepID=UPI00143DFB2E|nr:uncharacterized protein LOC117177826 [Belonocnema kinseyi]
MEDLMFLALLFFLMTLDSIQSEPVEPLKIKNVVTMDYHEIHIGQIVRLFDEQFYMLDGTPGRGTHKFHVEIERTRLIKLTEEQMVLYERIKHRPGVTQADYILPKFFYAEGDEVRRKVGRTFEKVGEAVDWQTMIDPKTAHYYHPVKMDPREGDWLLSFRPVHQENVSTPRHLAHVATFVRGEWLAVELLPHAGAFSFCQLLFGSACIVSALAAADSPPVIATSAVSSAKMEMSGKTPPTFENIRARHVAVAIDVYHLRF